MKRNYHFDNAKLILIILVVLGHYLDRIIWFSGVGHKPIIQAIDTLIYSFHMPAFIFIAGHFTKVGNWKSTIRRIVVPLLIFEGIYGLFSIFVLPQHKLLTLWHTPYWILWFLFSLAIWSFALPFIVRLKYYLVWSFILSVASGYFDFIGYKFSLSRTIVFLPFFLLGYYLKDKEIKYLNKPLASIGILLIAVFIYITTPDPRWFAGALSNDAINRHEWYSGAYRVAVYSISVIMIYLFLCLVQKTKNNTSEYGKYTIYVYLLHGFFILIPQEYSWFQKINSFSIFVLLLFAYLILVVILINKFTKKVFSILVEPRIQFLDKIRKN